MNLKKQINFLRHYNEDLFNLINSSFNDAKKIINIKDIFLKTKKNNKVIICGNGGSAATASHVAVDLSKNANIRAINFNEADLITCLSNDYGYENWMSAAINLYADKNDVVVLLSCSGKSPNIVNAAKLAKKKKLKLITFSGIDKNNPLIKQNKGGINIWTNSKAYNQIEIIHHMILLTIIDLSIGKKVYSPN
jgi:D-sedoheptulose 7-phosphate isomerase|tara:strand:+ start:115 stop:693 length:579 start_codon:yes stop_codon:yes gene_type:complete